MKKTSPLLIMLIAYLLLVLILGLFASCNNPVVVTPTAPEVIEQKYNPVIDSLKKENSLLFDSISKLKQDLVAQKKKTAVTEANASKTIGRLEEALSKKDTGSIIVYADDVIEEYFEFRKQTIEQDSIQDAIIEKQAATIVNTRAEAELQLAKYNKLKVAYGAQSIALNEAALQNSKLQKKLKRAKFWNKVGAIGTAAGVVLAGIVFL